MSIASTPVAPSRYTQPTSHTAIFTTGCTEMAELHMILVKLIGGRATEADLELDCNQLDALPQAEQGLALYAAYQRCRGTLRDIEVKDACDEIKKIVPFPTKNVPVK